MGKDIEYILCAAIKRLEPKKCNPYYNNDICDIEIGYRHHDIFQRFKNEVSRKLEDQGFYTSKGRFVDRREGMCIAWNAGQVDDLTAFGDKNFCENNSNIIDKNNKVYFYELFSEDLY